MGLLCGAWITNVFQDALFAVSLPHILFSLDCVFRGLGEFIKRLYHTDTVDDFQSSFFLSDSFIYNKQL